MTLADFFSVAPLSWNGIAATILSGTIVGLERQLMGKPVGVRTSALVCLGTYVFVAAANTLLGAHTDPSRVIGQVITGIGFLGAGVMLTRDGMVMGVTSAATIWMLAAIGVIIALDHFLVGIKLAILTVVILVGMDIMEASFRSMQRGVHRRFQGKKPDL